MGIRSVNLVDQLLNEMTIAYWSEFGVGLTRRLPCFVPDAAGSRSAEAPPQPSSMSLYLSFFGLTSLADYSPLGFRKINKKYDYSLLFKYQGLNPPLEQFLLLGSLEFRLMG